MLLAAVSYTCQATARLYTAVLLYSCNHLAGHCSWLTTAVACRHSGNERTQVTVRNVVDLLAERGLDLTDRGLDPTGGNQAVRTGCMRMRAAIRQGKNLLRSTLYSCRQGPRMVGGCPCRMVLAIAYYAPDV